MRRLPRTRGYTVVEMAVTIGVFFLVIGIATQAIVMGTTTQRGLTRKDILDEQVRRSLESIVNRVRGAGVDTLLGVPDAPATSSWIRYQRLLAFDAVWGPTWGSEEHFFTRYDQGEYENGYDDDGDGRIDNGSLIYQSADGQEVLCPDVVSVSFSRDGRIIHVAVEGQVIADQGRQIDIRRETDVFLEN